MSHAYILNDQVPSEKDHLRSHKSKQVTPKEMGPCWPKTNISSAISILKVGYRSTELKEKGLH